MNEIRFTGCSPTPLVSYLKALGILRLLSRQRPQEKIKTCWRRNSFALISDLDKAAITDFFLKEYAPSPVVAPWNGGSGFYPGDNSTALAALKSSEAERFAYYRETITSGQEVLNSLKLTAKPEKGAKENLLLRCRNTFSEAALEWLDSAFVLTDDGTRYPPLLGTGGNDGRLEFTNNFMQRLTELFDMKTGAPIGECAALLDNALFDTPIKGLRDNPIGQFSPAASGGANASTGFGAKSAMNPWDFVLALEGAMLLAAAAVKRLEGGAPGQLVYPFCVQPSGAGYPSAADADENEARCEMWMPLWSNPSDLAEIRTLFGEGRAWVGRRPAKDGVDFARAVASLGVDRGIPEFQRYAFQARNGLAYFAVPLQRLRVHHDSVIADLLSACDGWILSFLSRAKGSTAPGSIQRAARGLETAIFAQASVAQKNSSTAQEVLIALGNCERALARAEEWRTDAFIRPIPSLSRRWIVEADTGAPEYRLAAALASLGGWFKNQFFPIRRHLEPVKVIPGDNGWVAWDDEFRNEVVWNDGKIVDVLCAIMRRRLLLAKSTGEPSWPEYSKVTAWPSDIAAYIEGDFDENLFAQLLWGLCLIDFSEESTANNMPNHPLDDSVPPAFYVQLKLCFAGRLPGDKKVPIEPVIFHLAESGDGDRASAHALRRLHGSNIPITHIRIPLNGEAARRSSSALLFPLWDSQLASVGRQVAHAFFEDSL